MSNINFRTASAFTAHVASYANARILSAEAITLANERINNASNALTVSAHHEESSRPVSALILSAEEKKALEAEIASAAEMKKEARKLSEFGFEFSDADKALIKSLRRASTDAMAHTAITEWMKAYDLEGDDSRFINTLLKSIGFGRRTNTNNADIANGKGMTKVKKMSTTDVKVLFGTMYDYLLSINCIAPYNVPAILTEVYVTRKEEAKRAKEAEKRARKEARNK